MYHMPNVPYINSTHGYKTFETLHLSEKVITHKTNNNTRYV